MQQRFLLQILLLAQHVSGTTMSIIRSSRVLYSGRCLWYFVLWFSSCWSGVELRVMCPVCRMLWLLPVVLRAVVFKLLVWCGAEGYVSGLQDAAASCKPDTQPSAPHQTSNLKTTARNTTGSNHCMILLSS